MRLLQVIDSLAPGGAERSLTSMAPWLLGRGIELEVAVLHERNGLRRELEACSVPVHVLDAPSRSGACRRLVSLIRDRRPDLVHTALFEADVVGRLAAAWCRVPVVSSFVNSSYGPEHLGQPGVTVGRLRAAHAVDLVSARVVRRFHAVSEVVADTMARRLRVPRERVDVVWRGRDAARLGRRSPERRRAARGSIGVGPDVPMLVMLSRHEADKGIDVAIRALACLRRYLPDARLLVAGRTGNATPGLRDMIRGAGLGSCVDLLGPRDDTAELLCAADVLLAPSRREGLPGSVLEAMALELPVVASDIPAVREAVGAPPNALLVPVGDASAVADAVRRSLAQPEEAAARADRARARFEACFTMERASEGMAAFFARALASKA